jgi:hypothetical protein
MQKKEKFKKKRGGEKEQIKIRQPLKGKWKEILKERSGREKKQEKVKMKM